MKTLNIPELITLKTGAVFKVLQVTGKAGMEMPLHYSTKEAVVVVLEGSALLKIDEKEHLLEAGKPFIIPAQKEHSLTLKTEFRSIVIMEQDSNIKFAD